jgi:hypothetical protein
MFSLRTITPLAHPGNPGHQPHPGQQHTGNNAHNKKSKTQTQNKPLNKTHAKTPTEINCADKPRTNAQRRSERMRPENDPPFLSPTKITSPSNLRPSVQFPCQTRADHRSVWNDIGRIQPNHQHNNCCKRLVEAIGTRGWLVFSLVDAHLQFTS